MQGIQREGRGEMEAKEEKENGAQPPSAVYRLLQILSASGLAPQAGGFPEIGISLKLLTSYSKGKVAYER